jgi:hypothetical protein
MRFAPDAERQVRELRGQYEDRERPEAIRGLIAALDAAWRKIETNPAVGLTAPRPQSAACQDGTAMAAMRARSVVGALSPNTFGTDHVPSRGVGTALLSRVGCSIRRPLLAG